MKTVRHLVFSPFHTTTDAPFQLSFHTNNNRLVARISDTHVNRSNLSNLISVISTGRRPLLYRKKGQVFFSCSYTDEEWKSLYDFLQQIGVLYESSG